MAVVGAPARLVERIRAPGGGIDVAHAGCRSERRLERGEGEDARAQEEILQLDVHVVVVGVAAARAVEQQGMPAAQRCVVSLPA